VEIALEVYDAYRTREALAPARPDLLGRVLTVSGSLFGTKYRQGRLRESRANVAAAFLSPFLDGYRERLAAFPDMLALQRSMNYSLFHQYRIRTTSRTRIATATLPPGHRNCHAGRRPRLLSVLSPRSAPHQDCEDRRAVDGEQELQGRVSLPSSRT
jgi:hypothetical protein